MRLLLATAAIPALLLTSALACDFNHEAKTQATVTVADGGGCAGSGCRVSDPQDPTAPRSSVDSGGNGQKFDQPPASQMAVAAPGTKSVFGLMTADCASGNCK